MKIESNLIGKCFKCADESGGWYRIVSIYSTGDIGSICEVIHCDDSKIELTVICHYPDGMVKYVTISESRFNKRMDKTYQSILNKF